MKKQLTLFALFCFIAMTSFSQTESVGIPHSFMQKGLSWSVDNIQMPSVDRNALLAEDEKQATKEKPLRIGVAHMTRYTFDNCGRTDILEDGGRLWRANFQSSGALVMSLVFDVFNIPEEGQLYIYSPNHDQVFGPYTNSDIQETGFMVTDDIYGDELTVEYYEPANASFRGEVRISEVTHTYRPIFAARSTEDVKGYWGNADGSCHINVACPDGDPWHYPINSVVCIVIDPHDGYQYICSGAMVNNVRMDKTPYVLSANHCVETADQSHKFVFNYQTNSCQGTVGLYNRVSNGGVIRARSNTSNNTTSSSDFLLLEITGNLGPAFRDSIFFAGWDRSGAASIGAGIHHPGGDFKKISFPKSVTNITSGQYANKYFSVSWQTNPNRGVTEQGSSGSPLFNASQRIIGTLTSGSSACDYIYGTDNYGKMSYHWLNNGTNNNALKLQPWLDPDNTGTVVLDGMKYDGTVVVGIQDHDPVSGTFDIYPNPATAGTVTIQGEFIPETAICNIYNAMGQIVKHLEVYTDVTFSLNVSDLDNGVYFIDLIGSERNYKSKLVITR